MLYFYVPRNNDRNTCENYCPVSQDCNPHGTQKRYFKLNLVAGKLSVLIPDQGKYSQIIFTSPHEFPAKANEWNYVGFSYDGENGTFFMNEMYGYHRPQNPPGNGGDDKDKFVSQIKMVLNFFF
jgi:hypothetical protein